MQPTAQAVGRYAKEAEPRRGEIKCRIHAAISCYTCRIIKTNSSRWIRERHAEFAWQTGYGVFSVSESNVSAVTKYITSQEEHHKKHSFQDEFRAFLRKNRIVVDEKYIWG